MARICQVAKGKGYEPTRPEIFLVLLDELGFGQQEKEELCRDVDTFYAELYKMRSKERFTPELDPIVQCPTVSAYHSQIVQAFHSLQVLHLITEAENMGTGQRATSSTESPPSKLEEIT